MGSGEGELERAGLWDSTSISRSSKGGSSQPLTLHVSGKNENATGQSFYLGREDLEQILADAKLWSQTALRVSRKPKKSEQRHTVCGSIDTIFVFARPISLRST